MPADEKVEKNENAEVEGEDDGKEEGFTGVEEEVEEVVEFEVSGKLKGKGKKKVEIKVAGVQLFYFVSFPPQTLSLMSFERLEYSY